MARPEKQESWYPEVLEYMARTGLKLKAAVAELNLPITSEVLEAVERRPSFNRLLWETRHRYFNALATDPSFKKDTVIGRLVNLAQRLEDRGDFDKAAEALLKAAKVAGFAGPDSTVSVFGSLSQQDLDEIRRKVEESSSEKLRPN